MSKKGPEQRPRAPFAPELASAVITQQAGLVPYPPCRPAAPREAPGPTVLAHPRTRARLAANFGILPFSCAAAARA